MLYQEKQWQPVSGSEVTCTGFAWTTTKQWVSGRDVGKRKLEQKLWPSLQEQATDHASLGLYLHCATRDRVWS